MQQSARGKTYTIKTLLSVLGISRNTLRYYEQIGVISPQRDPESNYRVYTNDDVFRVAQLNMLKNAGFEVADAQVILDKASEPHRLLQMLSDENTRQIAWHEAVRESLNVIREISIDVERGPEPHLVMSKPCLVFHDECETGYENHVSDPAQDALIRSMPIATFGSIMQRDIFSENLGLPKWGRIIYKHHVSLLPELALSKKEPESVGGCPCVEMSYSAEADRIPCFDESGKTREAIWSFLQVNDLEPDGLAYTSHALPAQGIFYARVHLPVRGRGLLAKRRLAKLMR